MNFDYDISIVGGGLAGLTAAIQLRKLGYHVALFEKKQYPFHRVCGEYISMESWQYLLSCGIDLPSLQLPFIKKLQVSAPNGNLLKAELDLGGFGISRYMLDDLLHKEAKKAGVHIFEKTQVQNIQWLNNYAVITTDKLTYTAKLALGTFGKRSNIDVKWQREFISQKPNTLNNYVGIKYHAKGNFPEDTISLHNFKNGYCGISKIEDDRFCICYLTTAANLQKAGSIKQLEEKVLCQNSHLHYIFSQSTFLFEQPVSISQISFNKKEVVYNNIPLAGDACGMITPLCGNGMSMAMHAGKIFVSHADRYLQKKISYNDLLNQYQKHWKQNFATRLLTGKIVQSNFGNEWQTNLFVHIMKTMPWLTRKIIKATHGTRF